MVTVAEVTGVPDGTTAWGPDDVIVYSRIGPRADRGIWRVSALGGDPEQITRLEDDETFHTGPLLLPTGEALLFEVWQADEPTQIAVLSLATGERRILTDGRYVRYAATGHLAFVRDRSLWRAAFDIDQLEMSGEPVPVLENLQVRTAGGGPELLAESRRLPCLHTGV